MEPDGESQSEESFSVQQLSKLAKIFIVCGLLGGLLPTVLAWLAGSSMTMAYLVVWLAVLAATVLGTYELFAAPEDLPEADLRRKAISSFVIAGALLFVWVVAVILLLTT